MLSLYEKNELRNKIFAVLDDLESTAKIELCTEKGINMGREYAKKNFKDCTGYINKATICYAETLMSMNLFYNWWYENLSDKKYPIVDESIITTIQGICARCTPKDGTGAGAGAGALGGLFVGGITGAIIGGIAGALGGAKLTSEAEGESYYIILRQAISELYSYFKREINKQIEYI